MARQPRFTIPGIPQHVIQRGNNREPCFYWWFQPVNATHALNLCAGVSYPNVFLGRSFNCLATALSLA